MKNYCWKSNWIILTAIKCSYLKMANTKTAHVLYTKIYSAMQVSVQTRLTKLILHWHRLLGFTLIDCQSLPLLRTWQLNQGGDTVADCVRVLKELYKYDTSFWWWNNQTWSFLYNFWCNKWTRQNYLFLALKEKVIK